MAVVSPALPRRLRTLRTNAALHLAVVAGTVVRWALHRRSRLFARMAPGLACAVLASAGGGEVVSHVFGHGLAPWTACCIAAVFLGRMGAELNRAPVPPPEPEG